MTSKLTITRERLQEIINLACKTCSDGSIIYPKTYSTVGSKEIVELARMALAAVEGESHTDDELSNLLWYSQEATCHSDPNYSCEFQRLATPGLVAGIILELQERRKAAMDGEPVAEVLSNRPGNDTSTIDRALPVGTQLYRHAQPVPVVLDEVTAEDCPAFVKYDVTEVDEAWVRGFNACRAAKLAAAPQSPGSEPATVPGKWIPVSEQMPEREVDVQVYCVDKKEQMVAYLERNELEGYFRFATWRTGDGIYCQPTHWMPLPEAPQEDINALIPLVSRNEREVK
ncbi:TPA: DUF551 domain-containing protein [Klebsiella pneumoniae]